MATELYDYWKIYQPTSPFPTDILDIDNASEVKDPISLVARIESEQISLYDLDEKLQYYYRIDVSKCLMDFCSVDPPKTIISIELDDCEISMPGPDGKISATKFLPCLGTTQKEKRCWGMTVGSKDYRWIEVAPWTEYKLVSNDSRTPVGRAIQTYCSIGQIDLEFSKVDSTKDETLDLFAFILSGLFVFSKFGLQPYSAVGPV